MSAGHEVEDEARATTVVYPLLGDQDSAELTQKVVDSHFPWPSAGAGLIERFAGRYTNPKTAQQYRAELSALFAFVGVTHPKGLTEGAVNHRVARGRANNTRRGRLARACTFLRWCVRQGEADPALVEELQSRENPLRATPPGPRRGSDVFAQRSASRRDLIEEGTAPNNGQDSTGLTVNPPDSSGKDCHILLR